MKHIESAIQRELVKWLANDYPDIEVIFRKNEGKKSKQSAILDKLMGLKAGVPDLQLIVDITALSYFLELELKTLKGRLNDNQKEWHANFKPTRNRQSAVAYGLLQAQDIVRNWLKTIGYENK